jgi:hypothetical protein
MRLGRLGSCAAKQRFERFRGEHFSPPTTATESELRNSLDKLLPQAFTALSPFLKDLELGIALHKALRAIGATPRDTSDEAFWRWVVLAVLPDLCSSRWALSEKHFLGSHHCWPMQCWWFAELTCGRDLTDPAVEAAFRASHAKSSTDTIQALLDRPGQGYRVAWTRELFRQYSAGPRQHQDYLRRIMKYATAVCSRGEPELESSLLEKAVTQILASVPS